jgi:hypothetical protein
MQKDTHNQRNREGLYNEFFSLVTNLPELWKVEKSRGGGEKQRKIIF